MYDATLTTTLMYVKPARRPFCISHFRTFSEATFERPSCTHMLNRGRVLCYMEDWNSEIVTPPAYAPLTEGRKGREKLKFDNKPQQPTPSIDTPPLAPDSSLNILYTRITPNRIHISVRLGAQCIRPGNFLHPVWRGTGSPLSFLRHQRPTIIFATLKGIAATTPQYFIR